MERTSFIVECTNGWDVFEEEFSTLDEAIMYARTHAKANPRWTYRIFDEVGNEIKF